jgi:hypothetical protein
LKIHLEDFRVKEQQGREGLILRAGRDFSIDSEMGEELIDFGAPQLEGVNPFAALITVEDEESSDPADVGFFGPFSDVQGSSELSNLAD